MAGYIYMISLCNPALFEVTMESSYQEGQRVKLINQFNGRSISKDGGTIKAVYKRYVLVSYTDVFGNKRESKFSISTGMMYGSNSDWLVPC